MKKKISIKTLYLLGIITIGLIFLGVGSTYAMFTSTIEIKDPITIYATLSSESDIIETIDIEIEPNDIRVAVINLNNTSNTTLNYASFYITESSDIEVGVTHNFTDTVVPTGSIENGITKKVYIQVKNNGSSTANVTIGILSNSGNIIKSDNMILINDTNIDTTSPTLLITGQDMIVKDGLIRYYDGNNNSGYSHSSNTTTWKDLSGNHDGTLTNTTWDTTAVIFNGEDSYATFGELPELTTITMEATIIINDFNMTYPNIFNNVSATGTALYFAANHKPRFRLYDGTTKVNVTSDETLDTGVLHTITATYDGTTAKIYIDGMVTKSYAISNAVISPNTAKEMIIGRNPNTDGWLNAKIYSARIYNRALTETEIKQNMNADRISAKSASSDVNGTYTFISNKRLSNFTTDSITLTNGTKGTFTKVNDKKYNLNISGVAVSSTLGVDISENIFTDISGNNNNALTLSRYRDGTGPSATITKDTSTSRTVTYTFTFHEYTYNFTSDDITISEGTKGAFTKINQKKYTLVVTHASDGSKTITVKANSCNDRFGNLNAAKSLTHTITTDTTKPTITNIAAKAAVNSNTITATLKDNKSLTGYAITTSSTNSCSGTAPTSWTSISGTTYNLSKKVTTYGNHYIWTKDASGNTNCTSKPIYKITYTTSETTTCKINSASLAESSKTLVLNLKATCACAAQGTCKNNSDYGTDTARANLRMYIYGNSNSTYTITSKTTDKSFQDVHYQKSDGVHTILPSNRTTTSYGNGLIRVFVGYGRTATVNDVSVIITKIVVGSTTIYNGGFVNY